MGDEGRLTIVPQSSTIDAGADIQLRVIGQKVRLATLVWSAAPDGVAEVDEEGRVVGRRAGRAVIRASDGVSVDSAVVHVAGAAPADVSGYRRLSEQGFDQLHAGSWTTAWNQDARLRIVNDPTAPRSCCKVAEFFYPRGFEAGRAPASADFSLGGIRGLYVSMWWKASKGWHGHPSGVNKMMFVFPSGGEGNWYLGWHGKEALRVAPQHPRGWQWLMSDVDDRPLEDGTWYHIEFLLWHDRGEYWHVDWWVDGSLRGSHRSVRWENRDLGTLKLNPTWGGVGGRKTRNDHFRWDHIYISGSS